MYLDLNIESDLFLLFVLASSWSRTGRWENAANFTTYLKYNKKDSINLWLDDGFLDNEINNRGINAKNTVSSCRGVNPRQKVSFRKDYYSSISVLAKNWESIKNALEKSYSTNDYITFINFLNGIVERSHRIDNELFYNRRRFSSYKQMEKVFRRYSNRYNNIARKILNFKTPNEMVEEYYSKNAA